MPEYVYHFRAHAAPDVGEAVVAQRRGAAFAQPQFRIAFAVDDLDCDRHADGRAVSFIFLGDYIDRGPDSRGVIEALIKLQSERPGRVIAVEG